MAPRVFTINSTSCLAHILSIFSELGWSTNSLVSAEWSWFISPHRIGSAGSSHQGLTSCSSPVDISGCAFLHCVCLPPPFRLASGGPCLGTVLSPKPSCPPHMQLFIAGWWDGPMRHVPKKQMVQSIRTVPYVCQTCPSPADWDTPVHGRRTNASRAPVLLSTNARGWGFRSSCSAGRRSIRRSC